jgi:LPS-assembly protein
MIRSIPNLSLIIFLLVAFIANSKAEDGVVEVQADEIWHDQKNKVTNAIGNVEVIKEDERVTANEMQVFHEENKITARGNVILYRADGSVFFADELELADNFNSGSLINLRARMRDGSALVAQKAEMVSKDVLKLHKTSFTSCKICPNEFFTNKPLWQINAGEAKLDKKAQKIEYRHASFNALGEIPLFYTPYFSMPTPDVKRKSGLLKPTFGPKHAFGFVYKQPVYFNIANNMDATLSPIFTKRLGVIMEGEFRHLLANGSYQVNGSITRPTLSDEKRKIWRGHLDSHGKFRLPEKTKGGFIRYNVTRVIDKKKTYMKMYGYGDDDTLTSDIYYNNFAGEDYIDIRAISFQGLRPFDEAAQTPQIYPELTAEKSIALTANTKFRATGNALNLQRKNGVTYQRVASKLALENDFITNNGHLFNLTTSLRNDFYQARISSDASNKKNEWRVHPKIQATWKYPLHKIFDKTYLVVEPITSVVASPLVEQSTIIPEEDSQRAELSASLLFADNRYLGYDRISDGSWLDYGLRSSIQHQQHTIGLLLGQSYKIGKYKYDSEDIALDGKRFSDYLSNLYWHFSPYLTFSNRLRLHKKNLSIIRNENKLHVAYHKWRAEVDYTSFNPRIVTDDDSISKKTLYKHELGMLLQYNFYQQWWVSGNMRRKLGHKQRNITATSQRALLESGASIDYKGDCLIVSFSVKRNYTKFNDLTPGNTYKFYVDIPGL